MEETLLIGLVLYLIVMVKIVLWEVINICFLELYLVKTVLFSYSWKLLSFKDRQRFLLCFPCFKNKEIRLHFNFARFLNWRSRSFAFLCALLENSLLCTVYCKKYRAILFATAFGSFSVFYEKKETFCLSMFNILIATVCFLKQSI